jgi:superkiller protein 3
MTQSSFRWCLSAKFWAEIPGGRVPVSRASRFRPAPGVVLTLLLFGTLVSGHAVPTPTASPAPPTTEDVAGLLQHGFDLLGRNDATGAESVFRRVIDLQPESAPAHRGLGLALWAQRREEAACRELRMATRLDPSDAEAHYALARIAWTLSAQPDLTKPGGPHLSPAEYQRLALDELNKATALRPRDVDMRLSLAAFQLEAGEAREAVVAAQEALRVATAPHQQALAHATVGRAYLTLSEIDRAEAEFNAALDLEPASGEAHFGLAQIRLSQGKPLQAERELRLAIQAAPDWAPAYMALADILLDRGQANEASALLEKAVALNPGDWQAQYRLARLLNEAGDSKRAGELFEEVARRRPDFLPVREQLGLNLLRRGDVQGAIAQAEVLMAKEPGAAEGHRLMALTLWKQRNFEGALTAAGMALNSEPDSAAMLALQAITLWQLDRKKDSRALLLQAAKVQPSVTTAEVFCRLLLCDTRDINLVGDFLRKNRWVVQPYAP